MKYSIAGGAYEHPSQDVNFQRCVNLMPISIGPEGRGNFASKVQGIDNNPERGGLVLIHTPGTQLLTELDGPIRGMIKTVNDDIYIVSSNNFYKLNYDYITETVSPTLIGTLNTSSGYVSMAANPYEIIIVDSTNNGYLCNLATDVFSHITDVDFPPCTKVIYIDGYFMVNGIDYDVATGTVTKTNNFYVSQLNDGSAWDALDAATAESDTDNVISLGIAKGEAWLLGERSVEIWYNAGNATGMPFSIRRGLSIQVGCAAPQSVVQIDDRLLWLDHRGYIVQTGIAPYIRDNNTGYKLDIVSTDALSTEFLTYSQINDAIAMTFNDRGHIMYQITFPSARKTWVYDLTTELWHERSYNREEHLAQFSVQVQNHTIIGGLRDGKIYRMSPEIYTDNGEIITRIRTTAPQNYEFKLIGIDCLELRMSTGEVDADVDPYIALRYSNDGAHTWSDPIIRSSGQIGEYFKNITWNRLGSAREWVFEFTITDAVPVSIMDASVDIEEVEK